MSNRVFQGVIHQMRDVVDRTIGIIDESGAVISCSDLGKIGEVRNVNTAAVFSSATCISFDGCLYQSFGTHMRPEYAVFVEGDDAAAHSYIGVLGVSLSNIKQFYDEKYDRSNFIKNIILDNILPGDIYLKARELHFNNEVSRVVLLIRFLDKNDVSVYDVIQNLFPDKSKDFVINISETDIALVKEVRSDVDGKDLEKLARSISDALSSEFYTHSLVGIGTPVVGVKELARSFKEAQVALEVGKVFDTEKNIVSYDHLGIARLIYQLPTTLCECSLKKFSRLAQLKLLIRKLFLQFRNSLKIILTFLKPQESFSYIETLLFTDLRKSKSLQVLTFVNLMMLSCLK